MFVFDSTKLWYLKTGRENDPTTRLRSPNFRFRKYGYNIYLNLYPDGFAAAIDTWAAISFYISTGDYDDILPWPLSEKIHFKIRDQLQPLITASTWLTLHSRKNSLDILILTLPQNPQLAVPTSCDTRNFSTKLTAIYKTTPCILRFLFLAHKCYRRPSHFFSRAPRTPNQFQYFVNGVSCRVKHTAKRANIKQWSNRIYEK